MRRFGWVAAALAAGGSLSGCARAPVVREDPFVAEPQMREIKECETAKNRTRCGSWSWDSANYAYLARWDDGTGATLKLDRFDRGQIVLSRDDEGGATPGLTARYVGNRVSEGFSGTVTFTLNEKTWGGTFELKLPP